MLAGGLRNPKTLVGQFGRESSRACGLGADACNRLGNARPRHAAADFRSARASILGSESPRRARTESLCERASRAESSSVLLRQRLPLGRSDSVCPALAVEGRAALGILEWARLESGAGSRERAASTFATTVSRRNRSFAPPRSQITRRGAACCARCLYPESAPL
jgi:hypothetical protein